jgi:hypothetical protein
MMREMRKEMRSERLQKGIHMTIDDNVNKMGKKINNEGNISCSSNSFSILDDDFIIEKAVKMGINMKSDDFMTVNMLKDMVAARNVFNIKHQENLKQPIISDHDIISNVDD